MAKMTVNDCDVSLQIDSGADVNTLYQIFVRHARDCAKSSHAEQYYNVKPLGEVKLTVTNPCNNMKKDIVFIAVPNIFQSLLSLQASCEMGLLTINDH